MTFLDATKLQGRDWDDATDTALRALEAAETTEGTLDTLLRALDDAADTATPGDAWETNERNRRAAVKLLAAAYDLHDQLVTLTKRMCLESVMPDAAFYVREAER